MKHVSRLLPIALVVVVGYLAFYTLAIRPVQVQISVEPLAISALVSTALFIVVGYLYRSAAEERPDSFWLNATFFALIVELELAVRSVGQVSTYAATFALVMMLLFAIAQVSIFRFQRRQTADRINDVLLKYLKEGSPGDTVQKWSRAGSKMLDVDYYPEFFKFFGPGDWNPREKARREFIDLIPDAYFRKEDLKPEALEVPPHARETIWRLFVICGALALLTLFVQLVVFSAPQVLPLNR